MLRDTHWKHVYDTALKRCVEQKRCPPVLQACPNLQRRELITYDPCQVEVSREDTFALQPRLHSTQRSRDEEQRKRRVCTCWRILSDVADGLRWRRHQGRVVKVRCRLVRGLCPFAAPPSYHRYEDAAVPVAR